MTQMTLDQKIEGLLFFKGEPVSVKKLAQFLDAPMIDVRLALETLDQKLAERGLQLVIKDDEVMLGTRAELGPILEKLRKEELDKDLSKASLETLSVLMYKNGATRSEIDYIRGVNSSFILRNLMIRGLVEKIPHPEDSRKFVYRPTFELLSFMGAQSVVDLPEFDEYNRALTGAAAEAEAIEAVQE
jgi:segregation and condensation protein B